MTKREPEVGENRIKATAEPLTCGLIMPISSIDGCTAEHWADVKAIVTEAVEGIVGTKFVVKLVSDADDVGVIQKRIVQNVYTSHVIVCDVSGKNPNVMFELGLRLAFDKPTVIIKDDKTDYSFDTGIIEHVQYPRDLRFNRMVTFKSVLADKVLATYNAAKADANHSTFLKNFGKFHVASLTEDTVPADKFLVEMLGDIQLEISRLRAQLPRETEGRRRNIKDVEAAVRIGAEVAKYVAEKPKTELSSLMGDSSFINEMVHKCRAPQYFDNPSDFEEALERAVKEVMLSKSRN
jgi:hypothetical protein